MQLKSLLVWTHFEDNIDGEFAYCLLCKCNISKVWGRYDKIFQYCFTIMILSKIQEPVKRRRHSRDAQACCTNGLVWFNPVALVSPAWKLCGCCSFPVQCQQRASAFCEKLNRTPRKFCLSRRLSPDVTYICEVFVLLRNFAFSFFADICPQIWKITPDLAISIQAMFQRKSHRRWSSFLQGCSLAGRGPVWVCTLVQ